MEQSAYEALWIGVNVFVFITALTAGILLMTNVLDMVNYANDNAVLGMNGSLAQNIGVVDERVYTGQEMLLHYRKQKDGAEAEYIFKVKAKKNASEEELSDFIKNKTLSSYINKKFLLEYKGIDEGKYVYTFTIKE